MKLTTTETVKQILQEQPSTRNCDSALFRAVIRKTHCIHESSYATISLLQESGEIPSHESMRRCRQKCQEKNPELRGDVRELRQVLCDQVTPLINTDFEQANLMM